MFNQSRKSSHARILLAISRFGRMLDIKYGRTKGRPSRKHRIKRFWTSALPSWKERGLLDLSHSHLRNLNDRIAAYGLWKSYSNNLRELPLSLITQGLPIADNLRRRAQQANHDSLIQFGLNRRGILIKLPGRLKSAVDGLKYVK